MTNSEFRELLDRYLSGKSTREENDLLLEVYLQMEETSSVDSADLGDLAVLEAELLNRFKSSISFDEPLKPQSVRQRVFSVYGKHQLLFKAVASIVLVVGLAIAYRGFSKKADREVEAAFGKTAVELVSYTNQKAAKTKIYFADRSSVELDSGSSVVYDKNFDGSLRKVYLRGTGFFKVTKDSRKPFLVYTDRLVTKVLGTSFIVNSNGGDAQASVTVMTGRVAVYNKAEFTAANTKPNFAGGVLLTPNHAVALTVADKFVRKLAEKPMVLKSNVELDFAFDNTPLSEVFRRLETAYNIKIYYDEQKVKSCSLSVDMGQEDFFQKLELICRTLDLTYQVNEGDVYVNGNGCAN